MPSHQRDARAPILIGVDRRLRHRERRGTQHAHPPHPPSHFSLQFVIGKDGVDQSHSQRFPRIVIPTEKPYLARLLLTHHPRQMDAPVPRVDAPHPRSHLAEHGVLPRQRQVGAHVKYMPPAHGVPSHHRHDRLETPSHLYLQVEHPQSRCRFASVVVSPVGGADGLVSARAECRSACGGQVGREHDYRDAGVVLGVFQGSSYLVDGRRTEGVEYFGTIEGYAGDVIRRGDVVGDVAEGVGVVVVVVVVVVDVGIVGGVREIQVVVDWMGGYEVEAIALGCGRCRFGGGAGCAHGGGVDDDVVGAHG
mmetsp:Transcript_35188/g.74235  ORF Transcript_35188/g.74235 Transcript_35188/m.74235 type:complete len:307 (-) Transcript_35188:49-969(-)